MSDTIQDLYNSFSEQMEPIQADDRYFRYLYEMARASDTELEQKREVLVKKVDEEWISRIEDSLDAINTIIEKPRSFIKTEEEVVPISLAKKISADSVRHLSQNTQFLAPSDDGEVHPTRILNVTPVPTYDLYENRFIYHLIQRLLTFVDKRTDVIFWSTGNEVRNRFKMHSKIDDAYEEIEYNVEMTVKDRQNFAENDADNMDVFMRIDRVRRLVMALRNASFCQIMAGCAKVRSPIQRTNLIMKDPNYRKCYELWQFMERYDKVGYTIDVEDSEMAFDDEYMVQMYTNLVNNYTVFKSLTEDERALDEVESAHREPIAPKFVKKIKEEVVDSPDIEDVEIRRVFVEEVTQAQLDAEEALKKEKAERAELEDQLRAWKVQVNALTDERDDLLDEVDMAKTREVELTQRAQVAEAACEEAKGDAEDARAAAKDAEEARTAAVAEAEASVSAARSEAEDRVSAAEAEASARVEAADKRAADKAAAAQERADAQVAAAQADAASQIEAAKAEAEAAAKAARDDAEAQVAAAKAEAATQLEATRVDAEAARQEAADAKEKAKLQVDAARAVAAENARAAREEAEASIAKARGEADAKVDQARKSQVAAEKRAVDAEAALARALEDARSELAAAQADAEKAREEALAAAHAKADEELGELRAELERAKRERDRAQRRAESNSLGHYLLQKIRHGENPEEPGDPENYGDDAR